jgi:hypothetical protein
MLSCLGVKGPCPGVRGAAGHGKRQGLTARWGLEGAWSACAGRGTRTGSFLFADWYCNWCLKNMLNDTKKKLEPNNLKTFFMKLSVSKFSIALGFAFSIGFLLCNLIFLIGGHDFTLNIMNLIFHKTDFKTIMTEDGFNFGKLLGGMGVLFLAGAFIGYFTVFLYNSMARNKPT